MPSIELPDLVYRPEAELDLEELFSFIARDRPKAAEKLLLEIKRSCEGLRWFPFTGRAFDPDDDRIRTFSIRRRVAVIYAVLDDRIEVLGVTYQGRDLDAFFASRRP